jgi:hemin uptake protein HemP
MLRTIPMADDPRTRTHTPTGPAQRIRSEDLFGARREVHIEHRGEIYRLRLTRQDRLILTK